jgi:hypothetical protein
MRRQDRYILNGALIVGGATVLLDILMQWLEHRDKGIDFTWESYNGMRTFKRSLVGATVGGGLGYGYYCYKIREEANFPFNSDEYVKKILTEEHLKANPAVFKSVVAYREKVKQWLVDKFGNKLVAMPEDTGSFFKRTAIGSNYDLDIVLPFKRNSYSSLEEMYYDVYEVIGKAFGDRATVTKQTKAIGLTFENNGNPIHFDVVPGREINNYAVEKDLNLFVKPEWIWQRGGSFKTNVGIQKGMTINKPEARTVIKLLKAYRDRNSLPLPTLMVEQCVVDALSENNFGVYASPTENLLNCMGFISKRMEQKSLMDIANSNNNLHDKVTDMQKSYISNQLRKDIQRIEENPRYIKEIFEC